MPPAVDFGATSANAPAKLTISGDVIKTGTKTAQIETEKAIEVAVADFLN